jgi:5-hydroxyisourate hydrolase
MVVELWAVIEGGATSRPRDEATEEELEEGTGAPLRLLRGGSPTRHAEERASEERRWLKTVRTNADGRTDAPLLTGEAFTMGVYELVFGVGDYFARAGEVLPLPRFLDRVTVRFGISDVTAHYHIPLLTSPWSYTTYRGA